MAQETSLSMIAKRHDLIEFSANWRNDPLPRQGEIRTENVPLSKSIYNPDDSGQGLASTQSTPSPSIRMEDLLNSYEEPEDTGRLPYQALPGLNMAVNMATLTMQERHFFTTLAPTQLQDPCALMQWVVDQGRVMTRFLENGRNHSLCARPQCEQDPAFYSASDSLSSGKDATRSNDTSSLPSPSPSQQSYDGEAFDLDTKHSTLASSQSSQGCICPKMLLR